MKKRDFYAQYPGPAGATFSMLLWLAAAVVVLGLAGRGLWMLWQLAKEFL